MRTIDLQRGTEPRGWRTMANVLFCILVFALIVACSGETTNKISKKYAYVSVLYNEEFMMGIRVLGSSLKRSKTQHDMYLLVTPNIPASVIKVVESEGWIVKQVSAIANPHRDHQLYLKRLNMVFTKLNIYRLVEYEKIVILDADTMVISNSDELFDCVDFCAVVRNGFFNAGVMVIRPSEELFTELTNLYKVLPSYNGGEQGFLNQWFSNFSFCPFYDEARLLLKGHDAPVDRISVPIKDGQRCGRLSTQYNGDVGLYYTNDASWFIRGSYTEPKIIHFTFGEMKPWHWYSYSLFHLNWIWFNEYRQLNPIAESNFQRFLLIYVNMIIALIAVVWYKVVTKPPSNHYLSTYICHQTHQIINRLPVWMRDLTTMHLLTAGYSYLAIVVSTLICLSIIPKQFYDHPYTNFVAFVELVHVVFFSFVGILYYLLYRYASIFHAPAIASSTPAASLSSGGTQRSPPVKETVFFAAFWLTFLCGCLIFFLENEALNQQPKKKIWWMIFCAVFGFCFVTTAFFRLPYVWYRYGCQPSANTISSSSGVAGREPLN
eukprot:TRINITY_DN4898_c0_g1_i1.p1 TRINITY_DN4898_c0_g1~~TRINITY_DN4898_c0_g1_i1.p1  ORF type:complete len:564 (-),score=19.50 TRINITY_DN4898_c0_g1_i1:71-1714(-)